MARFGLEIGVNVANQQDLQKLLATLRELAQLDLGKLKEPAALDGLKGTIATIQRQIDAIANSSGGDALATALQDLTTAAAAASSQIEALSRSGDGLGSLKAATAPLANDLRAVAEVADGLSGIGEGAAETTSAVIRLAQALGSSYSEAEQFTKGLNGNAATLASAAERYRQLQAVSADQETTQRALSQEFGLTAQQAEQLGNALQSASRKAEGFEGVGKTIGELAFRFNNVVTAIQSLAAAAQPAYDFLIGSNERLAATALSAQTNLASSVDIFKDGVQITDPTAAIQATGPAISAAFKQIEKDTQSLVGVTSAQVNELFNITLTNAGLLNEQSKKFPDPIAAATELTKGWAASLKVVGIPLDQARQEINSILKGQIDQNSVLAKNLNINNNQVAQWKAQGILVDELNKRLDTFVAGNAIAARSVEGISSNIQDLFERIGREAGAPFLEPTIEGLAAIEGYLKANETAILDLLGQLASVILSTGEQVGTAFAPLGDSLLAIAEQSGPIALNIIKALGQVFAGLATAIAPIATLIAQVVEKLAEAANTDIGGIAVQAAAAALAFGQLAGMVTGLVAGLPAVGAAATGVTTAIAGMTASVTAAAAGGIPGLIAGLGTLTASLGAAATAALPLAAALAPLAGAVALTFVVKGTQDLKNTQELLDTLATGTDQLSQEALKYAGKLKALEAAQKSQGQLTAQQIEEQKRYQAIAALTVTGIDDQIKALKEVTPASEAQANQVKNQIAGLERQKKLLNDTAGGIRLQGKEAQDLGTTYEQLAKKVSDANRALKSAQTNDEGGQAAKELLDAIKQQAELGQISAEQASTQLAAIANNKKLEVGIQQSATDAIAKIRKDALNREIEDIKAQQVQVEAAQATGELGPVAAAQKVTALKKRELDLQLADVRAAIAAEQNAIAQGRGSKNNLKGLQSQQSELLANQAKQGVEAEKALQAARLEEVERAGEKRVAIATLAESKANSEVARLIQAGTISTEEGEQRKLKATQARITAELSAEKAKLAALQGQTLADPEAEAKRQTQILASQKKIEDLQGQGFANQKAQAESAYAAIEKRAQRAAQAIAQAEQQREIDTQRLLNAGAITQEEAEQRKLKATQARIQEELRLEQAAITAINASALSPGVKESKKREALQKSGALQLQLLQNQAQQEEAIRQAAIATIDREGRLRAAAVGAATVAIQTQEQAIARTETAQQAVNRSLERQGKLLEQNNALQNALSSAAQGDAQGQISIYEKALEIQRQINQESDPQKKAALGQALAQLGIQQGQSELALIQQKQAFEDKLAATKRASLIAEQEQQRAQLELQIQQNKNAATLEAITARRGELEARIAKLKADQAIADANAAVRQAELIKDPNERKTAIAQANTQKLEAQLQQQSATEGIKGAAQLSAFAQQNIKDQEAIAKQQRKTLAVQQEAAINQANYDERLRETSQSLELVQASAGAVGAAQNQAAVDIKDGAKAQGEAIAQAAQAQTASPSAAGTAAGTAAGAGGGNVVSSRTFLAGSAADSLYRATSERLSSILDSSKNNITEQNRRLLVELVAAVKAGNPQGAELLRQSEDKGLGDLVEAARALAESSGSLFEASGKINDAAFAGPKELAKLIQDIPRRREGGPAAGLTIAGEAGPELIALANGETAIASEPGIYNLPPSFVYTAEQTAAIAKPLGPVLMGPAEVAKLAANIPLGTLTGQPNQIAVNLPSAPSADAIVSELHGLRSQIAQLHHTSTRQLNKMGAPLPPAQVAVHVDGPDYAVRWERSRGAAAARRGGLS